MWNKGTQLILAAFAAGSGFSYGATSDPFTAFAVGLGCAGLAAMIVICMRYLDSE